MEVITALVIALASWLANNPELKTVKGSAPKKLITTNDSNLTFGLVDSRVSNQTLQDCC